MKILGEAKGFHLCTYGIKCCGEINQCQKPGFMWLELEEIMVVVCEDHFKQITGVNNGTPYSI